MHPSTRRNTRAYPPPIPPSPFPLPPSKRGFSQENLDYRGKLVEIAGPGEFSWREVGDLVLDTTHRAITTDVRDMSAFEANIWGMFLEQFPKPIFTQDEVGKTRNRDAIIRILYWYGCIMCEKYICIYNVRI